MIIIALLALATGIGLGIAAGFVEWISDDPYYAWADERLDEIERGVLSPSEDIYRSAAAVPTNVIVVDFSR